MDFIYNLEYNHHYMSKIPVKFNSQQFEATIRDEADSSVFAEIFKYHEYRVAEAVIKNARNPILDIGAHAGFFVLYCRALNKKVKIFAVEPEKNNLAALKNHLKINKITGVKVIAAALAGETVERGLIISQDSHNHRLAAAGAEFAYKIKAFTLSDFCVQNKIKKIGLLKMDIEGGEYEIFDSFTAADFGKMSALVMEYHLAPGHPQSAIEEKLRSNGFGVQIFPSKFDKKMGILFARNKRL